MKKNLNCEESDNRKKKNLSKKNKRLLPSLIFFSSLFLLNISISSADWTGPPGTPPTCPVGSVGCSYLLNTGSTAQTKTGGINLATTSGSVGIGTSSPGYKLDVSGTGRFTGALTGLSAIFSSTVSVGTPTASTHAVTKAYVDTAITNSSSKWTTSGTNIYNSNTGNVGIGTTSPEQKLDVTGNVRIVSGDLIFNHYSTNRNVIDIYGGDGNGIGIAFGGGGRTIIGSGEAASVASVNLGATTEQLNLVSDTSIVFTTNLQDGWNTRVDSMYITNSGNIGIGQASPSYKLDVSGTGRFTGAVIVGTPTESGHATTKSYVDSSISNASSKWTTSGTNIYNSNTGNVGIGTSNPTQKFTIKSSGNGTYPFYIENSSSTNNLFLMEQDGTGDGNWYMYNSLGTSKVAFRTDSGSSYLGIDGNVGIGTTSPSYKLDITGTGRFTGSVIVGEPTVSTHAATKGYVDSAVAGTTQGTVTSVGTGSGLTGGPITSSGTISVDATVIRTTGDQTLGGTKTFSSPVIVATPTGSTHATTKAYVDSAVSNAASKWSLDGSNIYRQYNNVGIGTPSPVAKLEVRQDMISYGTSFTAPHLRLSTTNNVDNTGFVGITYAGSTSENYGWSVGALRSTSGLSSFVWKHHASSVSGTEYMRITSTGNVGIGTINPIAKNHIVSSVTTSEILQVIGSGLTANAYTGIGFQGYIAGNAAIKSGILHQRILSYGVGSLMFAVNGVEDNSNISLSDVKMTINSVGDVGINDTTPSYKLDVNGTGRFTGTLTGAAATFSSTVGVGTPTASTHATTKAYVDSAISGAASKWTTSGNNIYNNNSGNVGIGIASPSAKLNISEATGTVHGAAQGSFIIDHENSGGASSIVFRSKVNRGSDYGYIQYQDTDTVGGVGETARLIIGTSNDFNDHIILQPAGSVGIGQTSPSYKLDVSGTGRFTGTVVVGEPTASTHAVTKGYVDSAISGTTQGTVTSITAGSGLSGGTITTSGTIAVDSTVIRTTGNQTLGGTKTFSSAVVLSTAGTLTTHAVRADRSISTGSGLSGGGNLTANRTLTVDSTVIRTTGDQTLGGIKTFSSPVVVPTPTGSTHATTKAYVDSAVSNASSKWTTSGSNTYLTTTTNNLGIGTTSPSAKIHISKTSVANKIPDTYSAFILEDTESRLQLISPNTGNYASSILLSNVQASGDQRSWVLMNRGIDASNSFQIGYRQSAVSETIVDNSSKLLTITTAGNVGIGQTAPSYKLDVSGTGRFTGTLTGAAATFSGTVGVATPTASTHATTKAYVDSLVAANPSGTVTSITAGSGLSGGTITTSGTIAVDSTVIRTTGNQTLGGTKTFSSAVVLSTAGTLTTHAVRADRSISTGSGLSGGGNLTANRTLTVDSTVIRTTGDQTLGGIKTFSSPVVVPTPTGSTHATTKAYVDSMFSGSGPWTLSGSNVYVTNTSHNVGIGTTSPSYKLDINGSVNLASSLNIAGKAILSLPSNNPETGPWNPIWNAIGSSKPLYFDEEFASGANNVGVYNNAGGTAVTVTRLTGQTGIPNSTGSVLKVSYDGVGSTSPGYGGVVLIFNSSANKTYVQRFRAKLPVGRNFVLAENAQGDNSTSYWLTNTAGTGKWEDYMRVSHTGNTGSFSSSGHIYVTGGTGAFDWYIASMNIYEVNVPIIASANTWVSQQTFNGGTRFPGSGIWNTSGNVGINDTTPDYKLDVNGTGRFTGTLTGAAATFSGTVGVATPTASTHATTKAYVDSLVAANPSGTVTSITAGSGLSGGTITTSGTIAVDSTVIRTTGNQTLGGTKTFSSAVVLSTAGTLTTHAVRADRSISTGSGLSGGGNLTANRTLTVDSTVIRTTGDQTLGGIKTFSSPVVVPTPTGSTHATTKAYVDSLVASNPSGTVTSITAGSGLSGGTITTSGTIAVDSTVIRTTGNQTLGGTKTFSSAVVLSTAGTLTTHAVRADRSISTGSGLSGGGNLTANRTLTVDSTVIRTTGDQTLGGIKTFSSPVVVATPTASTHATTKAYVDSAVSNSASKWTTSGSNTYLTTTTNNVGIGTTSPYYKLHISGGSGFFDTGTNTYPLTIARSYKDSNFEELRLGVNDSATLFHYINDEAESRIDFRLQNTDTEANGGAGANDNVLLSLIGNISGGRVGIGQTSPGYKLDVSGTGRFTGTVSVATPTASNHATTKAYVDSLVASNPSGTVTSITAGSGLSGGTITTSGTIAVDSTVIRTTGNQTLGGTKTFSSAVVLSTAGTLTTHAVRADRSISTGSGLSGGGNLTANRTLTVDSTVIRTTGDQTLGGIKTFSSPVVVPTPTGSTHATTKAYVDSMFSGSGPWTLSGSNVYVTNTSHNVGIGTTSPSQKLEINNNSLLSSYPLLLSNNYGTSTDVASVGIKFGRTNDQSWGAVIGSQQLSGSYSGGMLMFQTETSDALGLVTKMAIDKDGNVGIGTTGPGYKLDVRGDVSINANTSGAALSPIFTAGNTGKSYLHFPAISGSNDPGFIMHETSALTADNNKGVIHISPTDDNDNANDYVAIHGTNDPETIKLYTGGNIYTSGILQVAGTSNSYLMGNFGIGTTSPGYKLDVNGTGRFSGSLTGTSATFSGTVGVATPTASTHATTKAYVDGGFLKNTGDVTLTGNLNMATYKLTVGTIDPLFNINGKSYATYAPSMTGVKEESTGVIKMGEANCEEEGNSILCNYEIKFDEQKDGSDLWIFRKVTDFGDEWKNLEIILTPSFNGSVWYKKIPGENKILVSANINSLNNSDDFEISYRFTAARFDHEEWSNTPEGVNPEAGFIIK